MKTIVLLSKTFTFHSSGLFFGCPKSYILDHWEFMKAIVLLIPGSKARKSLNQASWDWFCRLLEPWLESHQIEPPGIGFVDFWSHGRKVIKSSLLKLVLSTSWANAEKSLNRVSWDSFCLIGSRYQHNITSGNILLSDHCSLGHLFVGPPPTHRAGGGPTRNVCLCKSVSIIICPPPLSHHTLYCYLQSRHSTKCNVLML